MAHGTSFQSNDKFQQVYQLFVNHDIQQEDMLTDIDHHVFCHDQLTAATVYVTNQLDENGIFILVFVVDHVNHHPVITYHVAHNTVFHDRFKSQQEYHQESIHVTFDCIIRTVVCVATEHHDQLHD